MTQIWSGLALVAHSTQATPHGNLPPPWGVGVGVGALPLWESVGMRRGFAPHFRHLDDLFAPQNLTMSTILFRSCWVPFRNPPFSACRRSFCPKNWPNLQFNSDLVGSHFELRAAHPLWFLPGVPPPPPFKSIYVLQSHPTSIPNIKMKFCGSVFGSGSKKSKNVFDILKVSVSVHPILRKVHSPGARVDIFVCSKINQNGIKFGFKVDW